MVEKRVHRKVVHDRRTKRYDTDMCSSTALSVYILFYIACQQNKLYFLLLHHIY